MWPRPTIIMYSRSSGVPVAHIEVVKCADKLLDCSRELPGLARFLKRQRRFIRRFPMLDIKALNDNDGIENQYETRLDWHHFCNRACRRILHSDDYLRPIPFAVIPTSGERQTTDARPYPSVVQ